MSNEIRDTKADFCFVHYDDIWDFCPLCILREKLLRVRAVNDIILECITNLDWNKVIQEHGTKVYVLGNIHQYEMKNNLQSIDDKERKRLLLLFTISCIYSTDFYKYDGEPMESLEIVKQQINHIVNL